MNLWKQELKGDEPVPAAASQECAQSAVSALQVEQQSFAQPVASPRRPKPPPPASKPHSGGVGELVPAQAIPRVVQDSVGEEISAPPARPPPPTPAHKLEATEGDTSSLSAEDRDSRSHSPAIPARPLQLDSAGSRAREKDKGKGKEKERHKGNRKSVEYQREHASGSPCSPADDDDCAAKRAEVEALGARCAELREEEKRLREECAEARKSLAEARAEEASARKSAGTLQHEEDQQKACVEALKREAADLRAEVSDLAAKKSASSQAAATASKELKELEAKIGAVKRELECLKRREVSRTPSPDVRNPSPTPLATEISAQRAELENTKRQNAEASAQLRQAVEQVSITKAEQEIARRQLQSLQEEIKQKELLLQRLKQSSPVSPAVSPSQSPFKRQQLVTEVRPLPPAPTHYEKQTASAGIAHWRKREEEALKQKMAEEEERKKHNSPYTRRPEDTRVKLR